MLWRHKNVRVMSLKLETEGVIFSDVRSYASSVGCDLEEILE